MSLETKALEDRARWIAYCIEIGFATKEQIPKLEALWDKFKDKKGRLIKEPVNTEGATTRDEVTMGDAWMSGPEDFTKAIEEQIEKYRAMFPDSPIHVLGTVIPPLNTEKAEPPIKLVFYSGKLWHSDKPFPVKPKTNASILEDKYLLEVRSWLSTAYEVQNPEVIPKIVRGGVNMILLGWDTGNETLNEFSDGYHITLPEGYGIENKYQYHTSKQHYHDAGFIDCTEDQYNSLSSTDWATTRKVATITLPEKTDTGERYYNGTPEGSKTFPIGRTGHGFEPSESQEDQRELWYDVGHVVNSHRNGTDMVEELMKKFHITRRK